MRALTGYVLLTVLAAGVSQNIAAYTDRTRYPRDNVAYAGDIVAIFEGSYREFLPTSLQVGLDPTFSDDQVAIIKDACQLFIERALMSQVLECAFSRSKKDLPSSRQTFEHELYTALAPVQIGENFFPAFAFIARFWDDPKAVGLGYLNLFNDTDKPLPGYRTRHYLHIALSSDHLGRNGGYYLSRDEGYWAGVIAHEFLHNLGYDHPTGYASSFIKEYGNCIWMNGASAEEPEGTFNDKVITKED